MKPLLSYASEIFLDLLKNEAKKLEIEIIIINNKIELIGEKEKIKAFKEMKYNMKEKLFKL